MTAPWLDATGQLRARLHLTAPLPTMERRLPLNQVALICVSLTSPDDVTAALELLRLGEVPLGREDRASRGGPLILVGGPGSSNPEPFADFFDFFCIGDGAELTARIANVLHRLNLAEVVPTAEAVFDALEDRSGLYVPSLYQVRFEGGRVTAIDPTLGAPSHVDAAVDPINPGAHRSLVTDGDTAVVVPNYGCKRRCSYCSISEIAYREYEIEPILGAIDEYLRAGIRQLVVNSATLTQHSQIEQLLRSIAEKIDAVDDEVRVYIGSMRFDEITPGVFDAMERLGSFSHTYLKYTNGDDGRYLAFAPEHGSRELLARVSRPLDPWSVLEKIDEARKYDVHNFVLYFVVGFESETAADRQKIADLIVAAADRVADRSGRVIAKINPLIPTPGTACQRLRMPDYDEYVAHVDAIAEAVKARLEPARYEQQIEFVTLPKARLVMEAVITRADRRLGPLIEWTRAVRRVGSQPTAQQLEERLLELGIGWDDVAGAFEATAMLPWAVVDQTSIGAEQRILLRLRPVK